MVGACAPLLLLCGTLSTALSARELRRLPLDRVRETPLPRRQFNEAGRNRHRSAPLSEVVRQGRVCNCRPLRSGVLCLAVSWPVKPSSVPDAASALVVAPIGRCALQETAAESK